MKNIKFHPGTTVPSFVITVLGKIGKTAEHSGDIFTWEGIIDYSECSIDLGHIHATSQGEWDSLSVEQRSRFFDSIREFVDYNATVRQMSPVNECIGEVMALTYCKDAVEARSIAVNFGMGYVCVLEKQKYPWLVFGTQRQSLEYDYAIRETI